MKKSRALIALSWVVVLLSIFVSAVGLFSSGGPGRHTIASFRGQEVTVYGIGIYQADSLLSAAGFRGTDLAVLFLSVPLLVLGLVRYGRGSLRGGLLLLATLTWHLYYGLSLCTGAMYNNLFIVYVALLGVSFYASVLAFLAVDLPALPAHFSSRLPARGTAILLFIGGLAPIGLWSSDVLGSLAANRAPELIGHYTTVITYAIDIAIIGPAALITSILLYRRAAWGYLLTAPMLANLTLIGFVVLAQTAFQLLAGVTFPLPVLIAMCLSWIVLGFFGVWFALAYFRNLLETVEKPKAKKLQPARA